MSALVKAAAERIDAATSGRALSGYSKVVAGDVVACVAAIASPDGVLTALLKGAANNPPTVTIWQKTEHLRHLLDSLPGQ